MSRKKTDQIRRSWTDAEIKLAVEWRFEGLSHAEIASRLRRTVQAVQHQISKARTSQAFAPLVSTNAYPPGMISEKEGLRRMWAYGGFEAFSERVNEHGERVIALPLIWPAARPR